MGRILSQTDGEGGVTAYTYDAMGNILTQKSPMGNRDSYAYNYLNNTIKHTDPCKNVTDYTYDQAGNLLSVKSGSETLVTYTYDSHMLCDTEKVNNTIKRYGYDEFDRKSLETVEDTNGTVYSQINYWYDYADLTTPSRTTVINKDAEGKENNVVEDSDVNEMGWVTAKYYGVKGINRKSPVYKYEYDYLGNPVKEYVNTAGVDTDTPDSE